MAKSSGRQRRSPRAPLPEKNCATCGLSFSWRKKWERCWEEVQYCSERCRRNRPRPEQRVDGD